MTHRILKVLDWMSLIAVWLGGAALLMTAFMVSIDVLLRKFMNITMAGADEVTGYVFAGATSWAIALTLREKRNIRIDLIYHAIPRPTQYALDMLSFVAIGLILALMANGAFSVAAESFALRTTSVTPLQTPLFLPQMIWVAGFLMALLMWVAIALRLVMGGLALWPVLIGPTTLEEETREELDAARQTLGRADAGDGPDDRTG